MRLIDIYAYVRPNRTILGHILVVRCGRRFLDIRFARHLPWELDMPKPLLAKWTADGFKWSFDMPGFHLRISYHLAAVRPFRKSK